MVSVKIFVSFDLDHDRDLFDRLLAQSGKGELRFQISGRSRVSTLHDSEQLRQRIREADQVLVICGEHTDSCASVSTEVQIAREEQKPYLLLWGRYEEMCTKPKAAKSQEGMFGWTFIGDQIILMGRTVSREAMTRTMKRSLSQGRRPGPLKT